MKTETNASCADAPATLPIDVVLLSVGLPDGVYYAGKRLTPWMAFKDRIRLMHLRTFATLSEHAELLTLRARRAAESIVVGWEIEGGVHSAPVVMLDVDYDCPNNPVEQAFLWGSAGHVHAYRLTWWLLENAGADASDRNNCFDELQAITGAWRDAWIIRRADIRKIILTQRVHRAAGVYDRAVSEAKAEGFDVGEFATDWRDYQP